MPYCKVDSATFIYSNIEEDSFTLTFDLPVDAGTGQVCNAQQYKILLNNGRVEKDLEAWQLGTTTGKVVCTISGLEAGTTYFVQVLPLYNGLEQTASDTTASCFVTTSAS